MKKHILLFASKKSDVFQGIHDSFSAAAKGFKGKVLFVLVDSDVEDNSRISEFFGINANEIPTVRLINLEADDMTKYKPQTTELTTDNVKAFVQDVLDGKLKVDKLFAFIYGLKNEKHLGMSLSTSTVSERVRKKIQA